MLTEKTVEVLKMFKGGVLDVLEFDLPFQREISDELLRLLASGLVKEVNQGLYLLVPSNMPKQL